MSPCGTYRGGGQSAKTGSGGAKTNMSRVRSWCYTSWVGHGDWEELDDHYKWLQEEYKLNESCIYMVMQMERANTTQGIHIQGYVRWKDAITMAQCNKRLKGAHLEKAKGTAKQNQAYCTDPTKRLQGTEPSELGKTVEELGQGTRTDLQKAIKKAKTMTYSELLMDEKVQATVVKYPRGMKDMVQVYTNERTEEFRLVTTYCLWGATGAGKSWAAMNYPTGKKHRLMYSGMGQKLWFDGYEAQEVLIIEDFNGEIPYGQLKRILDGYKEKVEVKSTTSQAEWTTVIITSNYHPNTWYENYINGKINDLWSDAID